MISLTPVLTSLERSEKSGTSLPVTVYYGCPRKQEGFVMKNTSVSLFRPVLDLIPKRYDGDKRKQSLTGSAFHKAAEVREFSIGRLFRFRGWF